jgi:glycosyltransferase involved in cell wall biosynthesis
VPPDDAAALATALARLAAEPSLATRLGDAARALVERQHDQRATARRMIALLTAA